MHLCFSTSKVHFLLAKNRHLQYPVLVNLIGPCLGALPRDLGFQLYLFP